MQPTAVDPSVSAVALLILGVLLLAAAWLARTARQRIHDRRFDPRATLAKAEALRRQGQLDEARACLNQAALKHPGDSAIHYRLACSLSLHGDFRRALSELKRACDLDANWAVSAMHDPDLRGLWGSGLAGTRTVQALIARPESSRRAA